MFKPNWIKESQNGENVLTVDTFQRVDLNNYEEKIELKCDKRRDVSIVALFVATVTTFVS